MMQISDNAAQSMYFVRITIEGKFKMETDSKIKIKCLIRKKKC